MEAPGHPGIAPRWTSSAKDGVGTALDPRSEIWFALSHGILNEIYYPRVDQACTRDCGFIVTDGRPGGFFSEEKRDTASLTTRIADGVPLHLLRNRCRHGRYEIEKQVCADPAHAALLQHVSFRAADPAAGLRLFVLLAPHLVNGGADNSAWLGDYKGTKMLFAAGDGTVLAMAASVPFLARAVGFVGVSDGWQALRRDGVLDETHDSATDGNVALAAELPAQTAFTLAIGFGRKPEEAAFQAAASLAGGFARARADYVANWRHWQATLEPLDAGGEDQKNNLYRVGTSVLRTHESARFPGGSIASLSIPWGFSKGDDDLGGYHLVWPRDLAQTAGAALAAGAKNEALRTLDYLRVIQEPDGHWPQNCWLDGSAYWNGLQMDETAFPILLLDLAFRHGAVTAASLPDYWPMACKAAGHIVRNGPATAQDRWEENAGYAPSTLAVEIAGLLAAADLAERLDEARVAAFLRDTADAWHADLDDWILVRDGALARALGVEAYYVRIAPADGQDLAVSTVGRDVPVRNQADGDAHVPAAAMTGPDALALVRFGLRAADDPRILDTVKVLDHLTRVELPQGPGWRRYNGDGYGEHADGAPFDGQGRGRVWPLLTGERAHYALLAGDRAEAQQLRAAMEACASPGGLFPEQVWDDEDILARELARGRPSGSAMPLVWAHAEHIKLLRSLRDEAVFDLPPQTVQRYLVERRQPRLRDWREAWRRSKMPAGQILRIELTRPGTVRWTADGWASHADRPTEETGLGVHAAELATSHVPPGTILEFTWQWADGGWRAKNFAVAVA